MLSYIWDKQLFNIIIFYSSLKSVTVRFTRSKGLMIAFAEVQIVDPHQTFSCEFDANHQNGFSKIPQKL